MIQRIREKKIRGQLNRAQNTNYPQNEKNDHPKRSVFSLFLLLKKIHRVVPTQIFQPKET